MILLQQASEAFHFALIRHGDHYARVLLNEGLNLLYERVDVAVKSLRGARAEVDLGEFAVVCIENINRAELVELAAGEPAQPVVELPRRDVDVFRADERADAGTLVALLNFIPPALALIRHHCGFVKKDTSGGTEQIEQSKVGLRSGWRNGREELPAGEDGSVTDTH